LFFAAARVFRDEEPPRPKRRFRLTVWEDTFQHLVANGQQIGLRADEMARVLLNVIARRNLFDQVLFGGDE
jgi:hypothetical protein